MTKSLSRNGYQRPEAAGRANHNTGGYGSGANQYAAGGSKGLGSLTGAEKKQRSVSIEAMSWNKYRLC